MAGLNPEFESDGDRSVYGNFAVKLLSYPSTARARITAIFRIKGMPDLEMRKLSKDS